MHPERFKILLTFCVISTLIWGGWRSTINFQENALFDKNMVIFNQYILDQTAIAQDACVAYLEENGRFADGVEHSVEYKIDPTNAYDPTNKKTELTTTKDIKLAASKLLVPFEGRLWLNGQMAFVVNCVYSVEDRDIIEYEIKEIQWENSTDFRLLFHMIW